MKRFRALVIMVLAIAMTLSMTTVAFAATSVKDVVEEIKTEASRFAIEYPGKVNEYSALLSTLESSLSSLSNSTAVDAESVTIGSTTRKLQASSTEYANLLKQAKDGLSLAKANESSGSNKSVNEVKDDITDMIKNDFNIEADTGSAGEALKGFKEPIGTIVGILAYVVIIGMGLFTAIDIAYIVIPPFRGWYDDSAQSGNKVTSKTDSKTGEAKLRWISDDAVYAVKVATIEEGKSPLKVYAFKRLGAYIAVAIVIFMLLTGNVQIFVNLALDLVSGIIEQIQKLAS